MPRYTDTIAALATPAGISALAVVRVSGSDTEKLATALWGAPPPPRLVHRGDYRDIAGQLVDDVLYVFFRGPHSYTGEDSLEISCHGNPLIAQRIVEDLLTRGARAPQPGEFTERAFLNGRIDLSQAEAVMDLIQARGERALEAANQQLRGSLSRQMAGLIGSLAGVLAEVEAYIDFPDEDLPPQDWDRIEGELKRIYSISSELKATSHYGELLRNGAKTVIAGAPNVGKSSLLNRLLGHERALVSAQPGTTRDYIEETVLLGPYCLRLIDTAGLNVTAAELERLGMTKSLERLGDSDLIVIVSDATDPGAVLPPELRDWIGHEKVIRVSNKVDLLAPSAAADPSNATAIQVSALTGEGLDRLRNAIVEKIERFHVFSDESTVAINARHAHALTTALASLQTAFSKLHGHAAIELLASDLRAVMSAFEEIGGRIDGESILDEVFKRFCIGK